MKELEQLCKEVYPKLMRYFLSQLQNDDLAEELTQETLYQACKSKGSFKGHSSLQTWIFSIARHTLMNFYKKHKHGEGIIYTNEVTKSAEQVTLMNEAYRALMENIQQLDETERQIVLLRGYADLDFTSIGQILNLKASHCRVIYCRSRQKLRQVATKEGNDEINM